MKNHVLAAPEASGQLPPDQPTAWAMVWLVGAGAFAIGLIDVALLYYPAQWANYDWEFATVGGTIEGLPLFSLGLGLMAAACIGRGWRIVGRLTATTMLLTAVALIVLIAIFALDVPAALRAVPPNGRILVLKLAAKTLSMGLVFLAGHAWLGTWAWRRLRTLKGVAR